MRRITLWMLSTVAALVLLFSYRTSTGGGGTPTATATAPATTTGGTTYTGDAAATRWGDVQVAITVSGGRITAVDVPVHPSGNRHDEEINGHALPILTRETLRAQSADIDAVSGATVTSEGYVASLQSALDAAHLS